MKKISLLITAILFSFFTLFAQSDVEMATGLRSSGKIYVVVLVMLTIFVGVAIYLFTLDKRIKKLENNK